jgi:hypothetical protein
MWSRGLTYSCVHSGADSGFIGLYFEFSSPKITEQKTLQTDFQDSKKSKANTINFKNSFLAIN